MPPRRRGSFAHPRDRRVSWTASPRRRLRVGQPLAVAAERREGGTNYGALSQVRGPCLPLVPIRVSSTAWGIVKEGRQRGAIDRGHRPQRASTRSRTSSLLFPRKSRLLCPRKTGMFQAVAHRHRRGRQVEPRKRNPAASDRRNRVGRQLRRRDAVAAAPGLPKRRRQGQPPLHRRLPNRRRDAVAAAPGLRIPRRQGQPPLHRRRPNRRWRNRRRRRPCVSILQRPSPSLSCSGSRRTPSELSRGIGHPDPPRTARRIRTRQLLSSHPQ